MTSVCVNSTALEGKGSGELLGEYIHSLGEEDIPFPNILNC